MRIERNVAQQSDLIANAWLRPHAPRLSIGDDTRPGVIRTSSGRQQLPTPMPIPATPALTHDVVTLIGSFVPV